MSVYIGSTCSRLHTRVSEHAGVSPRTGLPLSSPQQSCYTRSHYNMQKKRLSIQLFKIGTINSNFELRILESLHINKNKPVIYRNISSYPLEIVK